MGYFLQETPPASLDDNVREYLARMFVLINAETGQNNQVEKYTALPDKLAVGKLYYFSNAISTEAVIDGEGLYLIKSDFNWYKIV